MPIKVQIIGAPIACKEGVKDTWRGIASYVSEKIKDQFGGSVHVMYYDLFDADCPQIPPGAQLPLVLVNNEVLSAGDKISLPAIRKRLLEIGSRTI